VIEPRLRIIGTIRTGYREADDTPVQSSLNREEQGRIELDGRFLEAIDGLSEFSHVWLLTWLGGADDRPAVPRLRQVPFLLRSRPRLVGIFATRGPRRPNPIGLSLVRLVGIDGTTIHFAGVDMVDGTALLDVKPYVDRFDRPTEDVQCGWFETVSLDRSVTPAELDRPL
jgi:tRNA-Thr(GGU) m(6)t(6)A37 methyltransferase TsaA